MEYETLLIGLAVFVGLTIFISLLLALADQFFKVKEDLRFETIRAMLPGVDCGACGFPGCNAFAAGLLSGEAKKISGCKVAKPDKHKEIYDYLKATPDQDGNFIDVEI